MHQKETPRRKFKKSIALGVVLLSAGVGLGFLAKKSPNYEISRNTSSQVQKVLDADPNLKEKLIRWAQIPNEDESDPKQEINDLLENATNGYGYALRALYFRLLANNFNYKLFGLTEREVNTISYATFIQDSLSVLNSEEGLESSIQERVDYERAMWPDKEFYEDDLANKAREATLDALKNLVKYFFKQAKNGDPFDPFFLRLIGLDQQNIRDLLLTSLSDQEVLHHILSVAISGYDALSVAELNFLITAYGIQINLQNVLKGHREKTEEPDSDIDNDEAPD